MASKAYELKGIFYYMQMIWHWRLQTSWPSLSAFRHKLQGRIPTDLWHF